jgi:hypothetical protein
MTFGSGRSSFGTWTSSAGLDSIRSWVTAQASIDRTALTLRAIDRRA